MAQTNSEVVAIDGAPKNKHHQALEDQIEAQQPPPVSYLCGN